MSSPSRSGSSAIDVQSANSAQQATGSNEPQAFLQDSQNQLRDLPVYRESNTANASLQIPQENEYRAGYPSPAGTPPAFQYDPGMFGAQQAAYPTFPEQAATGAALPAQVVADLHVTLSAMRSVHPLHQRI